MNRFVARLQLLSRMNWLMTLAIAVLIVIGVLFVYSASYAREEEAVRLLYRKQMFWALAGTVVYFVMALLDYRRLGDWVWWYYGLTLLLLAAVLIVGTKIYGAKRWLFVFNLGIQPSELAKLSLICAGAHLLSRPGARPAAGILGGVLALAAAPMLLIVKEPDLGTALVFLPVTLALLFVGGAPGKPLAALLAGGALAAALIVGAIMLPERLGYGTEKQERALHWIGLGDYQIDRILVFLHPERDPLGAGWNKTQSQIAVGSGGLTGKGYLQGTQNILGFLPRTVAPNDFIFAVITEEQGFLGAVTVLGLFTVVLVGGLQTALTAGDKMGRLLCVGVMTMLFSHVAVNVSMTIGLLPITGLPLPLLSYGGTFMIVTMAALGLVQSVQLRRAEEA